MTHSQIKQALESVSVILEIIATDPEFKVIAANEYNHPEIGSDMGDAQHYVSELLWKLEYQQETTNHAAGTDSPSTKYED